MNVGRGSGCGGRGGGLTVSASESGTLRYPHLLSEPGVEDLSGDSFMRRRKSAEWEEEEKEETERERSELFDVLVIEAEPPEHGPLAPPQPHPWRRCSRKPHYTLLPW